MSNLENAPARRTRRPNHATDPILAVIREGRQMFPAYRAARLLPDAAYGRGSESRPPQKNRATAALFDHLRGPLLETAPTTPEGGVALAKYVTELSEMVGDTLEQEALPIIALISRVQLA